MEWKRVMKQTKQEPFGTGKAGPRADWASQALGLHLRLS